MKQLIPNPQSLLKRGLKQSVKIFISYRRDDSAGYAGHLAADLGKHFGEGSVFIDVDMQRAKDFVEIIKDEISSSSVLIAVIGKQWVTTLDNTRSLENPDDYVRLEITTALKQNVQIVPVLVHGAPIPGADLLPPDLVKIPRLNAVQLSDIRWRYDVNQLIKVLEKIIEGWQQNRKNEIENKRREEHRNATEEKRQSKISALLARAEQATAQEDWVVAINNLERVLRLDAHNQDALLKLRQVDQQRKEKLKGTGASDETIIPRLIPDEVTLFVKQHLLSLTIASSFILLGIIWFVASMDQHPINVNQPNTSPTPSLKVLPTFPPLSSDVPINYQTLFSFYMNQPVAADTKYTKMKVAVRGPIRGCEEDPQGRVKVYFGVRALTGEREPGEQSYRSRIGKYREPSGVYCLFDERPNVCGGDHINEAILSGTVAGKIENNVIVKDCSVLLGND